MSWQLAAFLLLGASLLGGFAWYERTRPPSQVIALVATLAAVAIAGRVALAAVPNLVATTDIVLFAGYALGPAPGFAVGAISGLVSNFWLGQGPWTPWQMLGWGGIGLFGAILATIVPRPPGRIVLAVACGLGAVFFGVLMNFSTMATFGGELSAERFGALQARAVPFDLMHVAGNVVLALIAGPALIRMLTRFRARFEWRLDPGSPGSAPEAPGSSSETPGSAPGEPGNSSDEPARRGARGSIVAAILALALLVAGAALPGPAEAANIEAGAGWLELAQNADGGFGPAPDNDSSVVTTAWTVLGLGAAGVNARDLQTQRGATPIDYLRRNADQVSSTGDIARTVLALTAVGSDPRRFAGRNLVADLRERRRRTGSYEGWPATTAFALMALREAGTTGGLQRSVEWLRKVQNENGGWGVTPGAPSDADTTGAVLQAIGGRRVVARAVRFLNRAQRPSGGYAVGGSGTVNVQSTAWAAQGLIAAGVDPDRMRNGGRSALGYLSAMQAPDGHFRYSPASDQTPVWVTANALVAVAGKRFPLKAPAAQGPSDSGAAGSNPGTGGSGSDGDGSVPGGVAPVAPPASGSIAPSYGGGGYAPSDPGAGSAGDGGGRAGPPATGVAPRPIDPGSYPAGPGDGAAAAGPGDEEDGTIPVPDGSEVDQSEIEEKGPAPSPVAPTGIGLGLAGLTAGGMLMLGRRRSW